MDIHHLSARETTLVKPDTVNNAYKIMSNQIKKDIQNAKDSGQIKDLLQLSGVQSENVMAMPSLKRTEIDYSFEAFFRKDMPQMKNGDGTYRVGKVKFTEEELQRARNMFSAAYQGINGSNGQKLTLDYKDYASMKLAENAISRYAKENFSEEQQTVLLNAMKEYNAALEKNQAEYISDSSFVENHYKDISDYYGLSHVLDENETKALNNLKKELGKVTGKTYTEAVAGSYTGTTQIATNKDLIDSIKSLFEDVDLSDEEAMKSVWKQYYDLVKPAYLAYGMDDRQVNKVIRQDTDTFKNLIDKIKAMQQKSIHYSI